MTFTCADQGGSGVAGCTAPGHQVRRGRATRSPAPRPTAPATPRPTPPSVRIDKTAPTITATAGRHQERRRLVQRRRHRHLHRQRRRSPASPARPANDVLGEGANQSASATVTDAAGNSATRRRHRHQRRQDRPRPDRHASPAAGTPATSPSPGPAPTRCPARPASPPTTTVDGEGDNLSSTASCTDVAGNTVTKTVTGIKIDRTAPTTTAERRRPARPAAGTATPSRSP